MPGWIESFSGAKLTYDFTSGGEFPEDLSQYALVVHCGGCMLNEAEMKHRMEKAAELLAKTDISISEVSARVGYESQGKFSATFKEFYNMIPSEYKKEKR